MDRKLMPHKAVHAVHRLSPGTVGGTIACGIDGTCRTGTNRIFFTSQVAGLLSAYLASAPAVDQSRRSHTDLRPLLCASDVCPHPSQLACGSSPISFIFKDYTGTNYKELKPSLLSFIGIKISNLDNSFKSKLYT